jgi:hypothetical protein
MEDTGTTETTGTESSTTVVQYMDDKGNLLPGWNGVLPEDMRELPVVKQTKDVKGLVSQVVNLTKQQGSAIFVPKADDPEAQKKWDTIYTKLGCPDSPDKYTIDSIKLPEGFQVNTNLKKGSLALFKEAGLNDTQANKIYSGFITLQQAELVEIDSVLKKYKEEKQAELDKSWGDKKTANLQLVNDAKDKLLNKDFVELMTNYGIIDHPVVQNQICGLGQQIGSDTIVRGLPAGGSKAVKPPLDNSPELYFNMPDTDPNKKGYCQYFLDKGYDPATKKYKQ